MKKVDDCKISEFIEDYSQICLKHGVYLVTDGGVFLQYAGELIDILDAIYYLESEIKENNS